MAENLRRVARRLRGERVDGLEGLDPSDPSAVSALLEHEILHLEYALLGADRATCPPRNWTGRVVRFEGDDGRERTGTVVSGDERNPAYLVVESGGARYRVHGCAVRHALTGEESARVREDWLAWTGGFAPSECPPEDVDRYVDGAMPAELPPDAVEAMLSAWGEEGGG